MAVEQKLGSFNADLDKNNSTNGYAADGLKKGEHTDNTAKWPRPLVRTWTLMLLLITCLLHCARMAMPICAVAMATEFRWSKAESGMVMGGFFWGYCFTQVLGGHASDRIGGETVLLLSTMAWATMTAFTPLLVDLGIRPLISMTIARFLMGVMQGVHYPSLASLCAQRVVEGERGFLMSTIACGSYLGMLMVGGVGSLILEWYGWECVFYVAGLLSGLWAYSVWKWLLRGPVITLELLRSPSPQSQSRPFRTRWLSLLKQPSVCAMVFAHLCHSCTAFTLTSWLPTIFKETFPHAKGWVFNMIPWLVAIPSSLFGGCISDYLIAQGFGTAAVRKMMQFCSMGLSSVFLLLLGKAVTFPSAVVFVSAAIGLSTFNNSGVSVNVHDLAPSCAGALFGIMNACGAFTGLVLVYVSGHLIEVTGSWVTVLSLMSLVNILGLTTFLVFGEARRVDQGDQYHVTHI